MTHRRLLCAICDRIIGFEMQIDLVHQDGRDVFVCARRDPNGCRYLAEPQ